MERGDLPSDLLKRVSRSFYLSLAVLPRSVRAPVGLAYLFARAADTIADTSLISRSERLRHLESLRGEFRGDGPSRLPEIGAALAGPQKIPEERQLVDRLPECFALYRALDRGDQDRIRWLLLTITESMRIDLTTFPGEDEGLLAAFESRSDLDGYTYYVAGCVGEFWTAMQVAHRPAFQRGDVEAMRGLGIRFGKGLQMTNILRDLARDLRIGRCYLPRKDLATVGVTPRDLLDPVHLGTVRPLLADLLRLTLDHYDAGWAYTMAIPEGEWRLRLACLWPLFIGLKTLALVSRAPNLLDPHAAIKITRPEVYRILVRSSLTVRSDPGLSRTYQTLRSGIALSP